MWKMRNLIPREILIKFITPEMPSRKCTAYGRFLIEDKSFSSFDIPLQIGIVTLKTLYRFYDKFLDEINVHFLSIVI